jgi:hypothetical protein
MILEPSAAKAASPVQNCCIDTGLVQEIDVPVRNAHAAGRALEIRLTEIHCRRMTLGFTCTYSRQRTFALRE